MHEYTLVSNTLAKRITARPFRYTTTTRVWLMTAPATILRCVSKYRVGCVRLYSDVSKVGNVNFSDLDFDKHDKISTWLNF